MRKLGKKQLTLQLQEPLARLPDALARLRARARGRRQRAGLHLRRAGRAHRHHRRCSPTSARPASASRTCRPSRARSRRSSSAWCEEQRNELPGRSAPSTSSRWRALFRTLHAELALAGASRPRSISSSSARRSARASPRSKGSSYGAFIVPGLIMLTLLTQSVSNASFGIYFPKFIGTIYELLSAPVSSFEIVIGYVGAAATKSIILGADHPGHRGLLRAAPRSSIRSGCWCSWC